jgi:hypothetical protein
MSSPSTVTLRVTSNLYSFSDPTVPEQFSKHLSKSIEIRRQQSRYYGTQLQLVYIVAWPLKVRPSLIVAYLRKPHICNNINCTKISLHHCTLFVTSRHDSVKLELLQLIHWYPNNKSLPPQFVPIMPIEPSKQTLVKIELKIKITLN